MSKPQAFPTIHHADHDLTENHINFIQTHPTLLAMEHGSFVKTIFTLPDELESVPSALYGPEAGDEPVPNNAVLFDIRRDGAKGPSRMIEGEDRMVRNIAVIGLVGKIAFTMYGTQASAPSPMEPWDADFKLRNLIAVPSGVDPLDHGMTVLEVGEEVVEGLEDAVSMLSESRNFWATHALAHRYHSCLVKIPEAQKTLRDLYYGNLSEEESANA